MFPSSSPPSSVSTLLSPSSSSSSSPSSHLKTNNQNSATTTATQTQKTMEEVWKDITVNSLPSTPISHIHTIHNSTTTSHYKGFILQDFLDGGNRTANLRNSSVNSPPPPPPPRTTTTEFQFLDNEFQLQVNPSVPSMISGVAAFDTLASSSVLASFAAVNGGGGAFDKKKISENGEEGSVDRIRRHKRMIKNRESAARSRARKQAYVVELELEVDNLKKENAALRKQQRLLIEAPPAQLPKKNDLRRTSTAPF